jgi:hypothetical protein
VRGVHIDKDRLTVELMDGRSIAVPLAWYPRLFRHAKAWKRWEIAGGGYGIHWPDIDEDLSTEGLLRGSPAPGAGPALGRPRTGAKPGPRSKSH